MATVWKWAMRGALVFLGCLSLFLIGSEFWQHFHDVLWSIGFVAFGVAFITACFMRRGVNRVVSIVFVALWVVVGWSIAFMRVSSLPDTLAPTPVAHDINVFVVPTTPYMFLAVVVCMIIATQHETKIQAAPKKESE